MAAIKIHTMITSTILVIVFSIDVDGQPDCEVLLRKCPGKTADTGTICGNDGRNYRHLCHLYRRKCKMNLYMLEKAYEGKCKTVERLNCPKKCESGTRRSKVCGSDGRTYTTACAVRRRICRVDPGLAIAYPGRCEGDVKKKVKVVDTPGEPAKEEKVQTTEGTEEIGTLDEKIEEEYVTDVVEVIETVTVTYN